MAGPFGGLTKARAEAFSKQHAPSGDEWERGAERMALKAVVVQDDDGEGVPLQDVAGAGKRKEKRSKGSRIRHADSGDNDKASMSANGAIGGGGGQLAPAAVGDGVGATDGYEGGRRRSRSGRNATSVSADESGSGQLQQHVAPVHLRQHVVWKVRVKGMEHSVQTCHLECYKWNIHPRYCRADCLRDRHTRAPCCAILSRARCQSRHAGVASAPIAPNGPTYGRLRVIVP
jgi:hypothetical protein